ncbi:putative disease resistance RPP13-like protein 1 isoform X2 [Durio zibethinus]|uniref:Disease resistance RPP13-like protein 1 isoform X2 n=1 Tax=Durio zibethinus TaxID=66656 RepID=A0A6P5WMZ6_DURZI|nr:putative disease resistance RPP13-like protein 1 isoform X2 [Durio zibethinus]
MSVIGEAALSAFLQLLFDKLGNFALNFVTDHKQVCEQLKEWESKLPDILAVLNDAEQKQIKDELVKKWLADLQDLAYDADDILDEFAHEALRLKLQQKTQAQASTSKKRKFSPTFVISYFSATSFTFCDAIIPKIKEINSRLDVLEKRRSILGLTKTSEGASSTRMKTRLQPTSVMDETVAYVGRDDEKREILELLKSNNGHEDRVSVISIVGIGGMGKTTLAQLVYNDASIQHSFDHKAWVCVSDDFDAIKITKSILKFITPSEACDDNDFSLLQVKIKEKLSGKKFLLVLDDIWDMSYNEWTILRSPFGVGTKIIVTTRFQSVSSNMVTMKPFPLDKLSDDDCLSIFTQHALGARDFNRHLEFKDVGQNIVRRCSGLPLAAKVIGGLLRTTRDRGAWEKIYESEIWDLPEDPCGIVPALRLSYHHLPPHLKQCFAYCSIIPKDYEFEEEEIILLWRAEGLLQQKAGSQCRDFGNQCFRDLVSRSFFQMSNKGKSLFVMHDLINDLAQFVAGKICSKFEGSKQQEISRRTRHLSYVQSRYDGVKKFEAFDQVEHLRTFLPLRLQRKRVSFFTEVVLFDLLPRLRCLRVLSFKGYRMSELPDIFENLKHLRYLDFSYTQIKCLPDSLFTLYHLETLKLKRCKELEKLPLEIENLVNLHYLSIRGARLIKRMPSGIGKLTNLQRLSDFVLGGGDGHLIKEVKILSNLKGEFCLSGLENVVKDQDAWEAKLSEKAEVDKLELKWSGHFGNNARNKEVEEKVLNFLCPHKQKLEELSIVNYGGAKFSFWIADSSFENMLSLKLINCKNCKSLPSIGKLPRLKNVYVRGMDEVKEIGVEFFGGNQPNAFASLEDLCFEDMPNWKDWDCCECDDQVSKFPRLRQLSILECPQLLGRLPNCLHSLQELVIRGCQQLVVSISRLPLLCELEIHGCKELMYSNCVDVTSLKRVSLSGISKFGIPPERIVSTLPKLERFRLGGCKELASLSQNGLGFLGHLSSLREIEISDCPQLVSLETEEVNEEKLQLGKICSIESLTIIYCERLNRLPKALHSLTFLAEIQIGKCPSLVSFAKNNLPPALKRLMIWECDNLQYLVDERENKSTSNECLLERLEIFDCKSLICLSSRSDFLIRLRYLMIQNCQKLTSLFLDAELPVTLKRLQIDSCQNLECIAQEFHQTTCLESIRIYSCMNVKSLPRRLDKLSHLQEIKISLCPNLVSLEESGSPAANLRIFSIEGCENFGALPKCMKNFTSLQELKVWECSADIFFPEEGFPSNLRSLEISKAPKIYCSLVEWGLHRLTSLRKLLISGEGCSDVVSFPEEKTGMMLPPSLTSISIGYFENLQYMFSNGFQNLTFLRSLYIYHCSKLTALPDKDMLLSLGGLRIVGCPLLKEECKRGKGREWSKIAHIPSVEIDWVRIIPKVLN